jgi:conjugal transfer pilus assembly protein TraK
MTGVTAQGLNLMALQEISAGGRRSSRLWWREHLARTAMIGVGLLASAQPAFADQNLIVADNGTVHCEASLKDLTRISLKDDQFASVSKVQTGNPAEDFQVVNEPSRGDIYLSVATGFARPTISFFGTTRKGYVYKFVCTVTGSDAKQIFVANADIDQPRPVGEHWPANLSTQETAAKLIAAMYAQKPVEGYDITWRALAPVNVGGIKVQMVGQYAGPSLTGKLLKLSNAGTKPVTLSEDQVGPANAIAISIANSKLEAGQETTAFVVVRTVGTGDQP